MYFDQRGPLIFSASIHFAVIVFFVIKSMIQPEKEPEEMIFELVSPPSGAPAVETRSIEYIPEEMDLPTPEDIPDPEPLELPPEPEPETVLEETIPDEPEPPKIVNFADFKSSNPIPKQRIPPRKPPVRRTNDLTREFERLKENLSQLHDVELPATMLSSVNAADQSKLESYFGQLIQAILNSVEIHPLGGSPLKTKVQFNLAPTGRISGAHVVSSSGDAAYDRKVVDGFIRLGRFRAPPGFSGTETLTLTIKQSDR